MDLPYINQLQNAKRAQSAPLFAKKINRSTYKPPFYNELENNNTSNLTKPSLNNQDDSLIIGFELHNSIWKQKIKEIEQRPKGWLPRFGADIDESIINVSPLTKTQLREKRIIDSGWKNITETKVNIPRPHRDINIHSVPDYQNYSKNELSTYCYSCWKHVGLGATFVQCTKCPLVSHLDCISNKEQFIKQSVLFPNGMDTQYDSGYSYNSSNYSTNPSSPNKRNARFQPDTDNTDNNINQTNRPHTSASFSASNKTINVVQFDLSTSSIVSVAKKTAVPKFQRKKTLPLMNVNGSSRDLNSNNNNNNSNNINNSSGSSNNLNDTSTALAALLGSTGKSAKQSFNLNIPGLNNMNYGQSNKLQRTNSSANLFNRSPTATSTTRKHRQGSMSAMELSDDITSQQLDWICPFCFYDVQFFNNFNKQKHHTLLIEMIRLSNCVKLQSYFRMYPKRNQYRTMKKGFKLLQQATRMRRFQLRDEQERANQRFPFRICVNEIKMFIKNDTKEVVGNIDAIISQYNAFSRQNSNNSMFSTSSGGYSSGFPLLQTKPYIVGEMTSMSYDKVFYAPGGVVCTNSNSNVNNGVNSDHNRKGSTVTSSSIPNTTTNNSNNSSNSVTNSSSGNNSPPRRGSPLKVSITESQVIKNMLMAPKSTNMKQIAELTNIFTDYFQEAPQYAKTYRSLQILPKNTLFLTVSVHEYPPQNDDSFEVKRAVQLNRVDVVLKSNAKLSKIKHSTLQKLGYSNLNQNTVNYVMNNFKIATFTTAKPYILIPYCRANTEVKLTVSEVTEWPKAVFVGQVVHNIKHYILRKRSMSTHQALDLVGNFSAIPSQEEGGKLNMQQRREHQHASHGNSHFMANTTANSSSTAGSGGGALGTVTVRKKDAGVNYSAGIISWSLLAMGYSEYNDFGFIDALNQESIKSTSKKCWCVLIDRILMVYSVSKDSVQPKHTVDLKTAQVTLLADEVIRVKFNTDTLFFHCLSAKDCEKWFRKFYTQSLSNTTLSLNHYLKKRGAIEYSSYPGYSATINGTIDANGTTTTTAQHSKRITRHNQVAGGRNTRIRTSMEEIDLLEFEIETFLSNMKHDFIELTAKDLLLQHENKNKPKLQRSDTSRFMLSQLTQSIISGKFA